MKKTNTINYRFLAGVATGSLPALPPGEEIYDVALPVGLPYPWLHFFLHYAGICLIIWLVYRLYIWFITPAPMKKKKLPPIDPLVEALRALERLKKSPLWENGQVKDVCEQLTVILKHFLKSKFNLGIGVAATSDELIASMRTAEVERTLIRLSLELFDICDSVRYAKGHLGTTTFDDLLSSVKTLLTREDWK